MARAPRSHGLRRALILAAGRGHRLRPLTDDRPKCLVWLAGQSLIDWQLEALRAAGFEEIAIVVGYRGNVIRGRGLTYFENPAWASSSMVASLRCARDWLASEPCVVSYGDIVYHPEIVERLAASPYDLAIAYDVLWRPLWEARFERPEDDAESLRIEGGRVVEIGRRVHDLGMPAGQYLGLVKLSPAAWRRAETSLARLDAHALRAMETTSLLQHLLAEGVEVGGVPVEGRWCEVDCERDLDLYESRIARDERWTHDWRF